MKIPVLIGLILIGASVFVFYLFSSQKQVTNIQNPLPVTTPTQIVREIVSPTPYPDTRSAIAAVLADKYQKPVSEVNVKVDKEVPGYASGTVAFGQGGPGEVGAWLAVLGNGWDVVWDGNGNVDCTKMRTEYGFPDTILKPNFCD